VCALAQDDEAAVQTIADSPHLLAEARNELPLVRGRAMMPATADEIRAVIGRRFAVYPQPRRSDGEASEWWADYFDVLLGKVSAEALECAMQAWVAKPTSQFMPKPGELYELAMATVTPGARAVGIFSKAAKLATEREDLARRGVLFQAPEVSLKRMPKTPEDREFVRQAAAEMREAMDEKLFERRRNNESGKSQGVVGADGITELMCKHMGLVFRPVGAPDEEPEATDDLDDACDFGPPP
jgi:hypothetical protein